MWFSSQKHAGRWTGGLNVWMYVHMALFDPFQSVFPAHTQCSQDRSQIHADQAKDECRLLYWEGTCTEVKATVFVSVFVRYYSHASVQHLCIFGSCICMPLGVCGTTLPSSTVISWVKADAPWDSCSLFSAVRRRWWMSLAIKRKRGVWPSPEAYGVVYESRWM